MKPYIYSFFIFCLGIFSLSAHAHRAGESYVYLNVTNSDVTGRFEVTLEHLNKVVNLDRNKDSKFTLEEFLAVADDAGEVMQQTLFFHAVGEKYSVEITGYEETVLETSVGDFARILFSIPGLEGVPDNLEADYRFLFEDIDPQHRGFAVIENNVLTGVKDQEANVVAEFGPGNYKNQNIRLNPLKGYESVGLFIGHGVWQTRVGYDHILFIIALLLPSVMLMREGRYLPVDQFSEAFGAALKAFLLFAVSYSIAVSLATILSDVVRLPSRLVDSAIVLSIGLYASRSVFPVFVNRIGVLVCLSGGVHGLGLANVFIPLNIEPVSQVPSLIGFNLGVALGLFAILILIIPILYLLRNWIHYNFIFLRLGSLGLIALSLMWFVKRAFGL